MTAATMPQGPYSSFVARCWVGAAPDHHPLLPGAVAVGAAPGYGAMYLLDEPAAQAAAGHQQLTRDDLSDDQAEVFAAVLRWGRGPDCIPWGTRRVTSLGGYAGTGKTTVVSLLARELGPSSVAFAAFTGRASSVLRAKLAVAGIEPRSCGTLHQLLYTPHEDPTTGRIVGWSRKTPEDLPRIIIVDEASMVGHQIHGDLLEIGVPILAVGDHGQLPPVASVGVSMVTDPIHRLEVVHRQASGSPVIGLATAIRTGTGFRPGRTPDGRCVVFRSRDQMLARMRDTVDDWRRAVVLCRFNRTRVHINRQVREWLGLRGELAEGDVVVCLKNTRFGDGPRLCNGMRGYVLGPVLDDLSEDHIGATICFPDDGFAVVARINRPQIGRPYSFREFDDAREAGHRMPIVSWEDVGGLFDYGYAMTVHKAQGSEWPTVAVVEERMQSDSHHREWLYTGVTRASETIYVAKAA